LVLSQPLAAAPAATATPFFEAVPFFDPKAVPFFERVPEAVQDGGVGVDSSPRMAATTALDRTCAADGVEGAAISDSGDARTDEAVTAATAAVAAATAAAAAMAGAVDEGPAADGTDAAIAEDDVVGVNAALDCSSAAAGADADADDEDATPTAPHLLERSCASCLPRLREMTTKKPLRSLHHAGEFAANA